MQDHYQKTAVFLEAAIRKIGGFGDASSTRILDFGCGRGQLLSALLQAGFDAYGCDSSDFASSYHVTSSERLKVILPDPYRLPFDDGTFDIIVSTSVLEHTQNKEECFREMLRVLKPGGYAMHLYPGKWYLPYEPHMYVPFVNYVWPRCPKWWFKLWARIGIRNEHQKDHYWKDVAESNYAYSRTGISYWTTGQYRDLSLRIFGNCSWPMEFYIENSFGSYAGVARKLPLRRLTGLLARELRMGFMIHKKFIRS